MKRNSSLCFLVSISVSKSAAPFAVELTLGRITTLAKTNREQSLIVHALFGKGNLQNWLTRLEIEADLPVLEGPGGGLADLHPQAYGRAPLRASSRPTPHRGASCDLITARSKTIGVYVLRCYLQGRPWVGSELGSLRRREIRGSVLFAGQQPYHTWRRLSPPDDPGDDPQTGEPADATRAPSGAKPRRSRLRCGSLSVSALAVPL